MADPKAQLAAAFQDDEIDEDLFTVTEVADDLDITTPIGDRGKRDKTAISEPVEREGFGKFKIETDADGEAFLKNYIDNMGWKMQERINRDENDSIDSEADEEFLEKADQFETKYNFRFEEAGGNAIASHSRQVRDSVRLKDSKRKKERDSRKERKEAEKAAKTAELERLKALKRKELETRLSEIEKATGGKLATAPDILDTEFDPDTYDQDMDHLLGEDYYECEDNEYAVGEDEYTQEEGVAIEEDIPDEGADTHDEPEDNMWYYCDGCVRPIQPGNMGYDCKDCEDVTICHFCKKSQVHPSSHKLAKFLVADHEKPPSDWQSVLMDLKKKNTKDIVKGKYDELFNLEYEDLIAGDVPCRFKYARVESDSFGLSTEAILAKSDKELNSAVSLKKLHPYRKAHAMKRVKYHDKIKRTQE